MLLLLLDTTGFTWMASCINPNSSNVRKQLGNKMIFDYLSCGSNISRVHGLQRVQTSCLGHYCQREMIQFNMLICHLYPGPTSDLGGTWSLHCNTILSQSHAGGWNENCCETLNNLAPDIALIPSCNNSLMLYIFYEQYLRYWWATAVV